MTKQQRTLIEEQVVACHAADMVLQGNWRGRGSKAARADAASSALLLVNDAARRLLAYRAKGKNPLPEYPPPFDRLSMLQETRRNLLRCL